MTTPTTPQRAPLHLPFVIVAILAGVGLVLVAGLYALERTEAVQGFTGFFLTVLVIVTGFAGTVYQLGKQAQQIDEIRTNTNGALSAEKARVAVLEQRLLALGETPPTTGAPATPHVVPTP